MWILASTGELKWRFALVIHNKNKKKTVNKEADGSIDKGTDKD